MDRWLLVDGNNALLRAIHAMRSSRSDLSSDDGVPTGALLVFVNTLSRHVREERPTHLVVVWDDGYSDYRRSIYSGYKSARTERVGEEQPESPFDLAKTFLTLAGVHHVQRPGVEADDLIAGYCIPERSPHEIVIVSSDKDFLQLLDEGRVEQVRLGSASTPTDRWDASRVLSDMGCLPEHLPLVMALTGDVSDSIPGVPRVGPKTAVKLLAATNWDLEALLRSDHPLLSGHERDVIRNLALVDLSTSTACAPLPDPPRFTPTTSRDLMWGQLRAFLDKYQMRSVWSRLLDGTLWEGRPSTARPDFRLPIGSLAGTPRVPGA